MDAAKLQVEDLADQIHKLELNLDTVHEKLENLLQSLIAPVEELKPREEKKIKYDIEDLEKEEMNLEESYCKKRMELVKARHNLRKKILEMEGKGDDKKKSLDTLRSTLMTGKRASSAEISRRNFEVDQGALDGNHKADSDIVTQHILQPKDLEIDRSKKLGSGAFGDVFTGKLRGGTVAVKKLNMERLDDEAMNAFKAEVAIMAKLRHPNVLLFMGACITPGHLALVTELMSKGSVYDQLQKKIHTFRTRMLWAKDAALGMTWLHGSDPPFLHLDLKSQNLLVSENFTVKVADFGLTQMKQQNAHKGKMSPEMLLDQGFDEKADVYSYGIVLWELYTQDEPYKGQFSSLDELIDAVSKKGKRPEIPADCPDRLKKLIQACWNPLPANRPTFASIMKNNEIDHIIIDGVISAPNEMGRKLWRTNWLEKSHVPFKDFLPVFLKTIGVPMPRDPEDIQILCLKDLIVKKDRSGVETVSIDDFGKMLEWFGPLEPGNVILRRIESRLRSKGFFGGIETAEAEKLLNGKKKGTFLLRFSTRDPGCYAITVLSKTGVLKHYRISHRAGMKYLLGQNEYDSLDSLMKDHKKDLYLKTPLSGSKYEQMFIANDKRLATEGYMDQDFIHHKK